jgi:hypothetical protein
MAGTSRCSVKIIVTVSGIKQQLYALCQQYISRRIAAIEEALRDAQSSANEETKSSAGDKYETGRAMAQLEIEKNTTQLAEALNLKRKLDAIRLEPLSLSIRAGSLIQTTQGNFFIAISVGKLEVQNNVYLVVAPESPVGIKLMGLQKGDMFTFGNRNYKIDAVE